MLSRVIMTSQNPGIHIKTDQVHWAPFLSRILQVIVLSMKGEDLMDTIMEDPGEAKMDPAPNPFIAVSEDLFPDSWNGWKLVTWTFHGHGCQRVEVCHKPPEAGILAKGE